MPSGPQLHRLDARAAAADALARAAPVATRWLERILARHDPSLTLAQHTALAAVADGDVVATDLAVRWGVSSAAVSQLLGALEAAGLVARPRAGDDRRRQSLALTEEGERVLASLRVAVRDGLAGALAGLTAREATALARALPLLERALGGVPPPPRPGPRPPAVALPRPPHRTRPPGSREPHPRPPTIPDAPTTSVPRSDRM